MSGEMSELSESGVGSPDRFGKSLHELYMEAIHHIFTRYGGKGE